VRFHAPTSYVSSTGADLVHGSGLQMMHSQSTRQSEVASCMCTSCCCTLNLQVHDTADHNVSAGITGFTVVLCLPGNAPTLMAFDDLGKVAPLWMNLSLAIFLDKEANKEWG
jgi:hypothetical protein